VVTITGYLGTKKNVVIPNIIEGCLVTSIGDSAFKNCTSLTSVTIPESVTKIGNYAFSQCGHLTGIVIPDSVTFIGHNVFSGCNEMTNVIFKGDAPETVPGIFCNTSTLKTIYYVEGTSGWTNPWNTKATAALKQEDIFILSAPVYQMVLTNADISLEVSGFSLSELSYQWYKDGIAIEGATTPIYFIESVQGADSGSYTVTVSNEYTNVSKEATLDVITKRTGDPDSDFKYTLSGGVATITGYLGTNANVAIPNIIEGCLVSSIGANAFYGIDNLESITIPDTLTHIGGRAFQMCGLRTVVIGNGVTSIEMYAFSNCSSLTSIIIPKNVNNIGLRAFVNCWSLELVIFEGDAPSVESDVFTGCNALSAIYCMEGTSGWTDPWASKATVVLKKEEIFITGSPVNQTVLPDTDVSFAVSAHSPPELSYQWYKDGVAIEGATTPVYFIKSAQGEDSGSYTVTISSEYTSVSREAKLNVVTERTGDPDSDFQYTLNGKAATITEYLGTNKNIAIPNIIEGCLVTRIDNMAFVGRSDLTNITIPDTVTDIGEYAFWGCRRLTSITIPDSITIITGKVFSGCLGLTSVVIGDSVTLIDYYAFADCSSLKDIYFKGNAPSMGLGVFDGCDALETIYYIEGTEGWTNPWQGIATATWTPGPDLPRIEVAPDIEVNPETGAISAFTMNFPETSTLEWSSDLKSWSDVPEATGGSYRVVLEAVGGRYYRLKSQ
jgi:hypothetical protein